MYVAIQGVVGVKYCLVILGEEGVEAQLDERSLRRSVTERWNDQIYQRKINWARGKWERKRRIYKRVVIKERADRLWRGHAQIGVGGSGEGFKKNRTTELICDHDL